MTEQKQKRLIVAGTVGAVLLMIILIIVMLFQIVKISIEKQRSAELDAAVIEYNQLLESGEETLETRQLKWWIIQRAKELGYKLPDDHIYD